MAGKRSGTMTDNRTTELQSLSKLKTAGKLRYWRGTIEIPESELHAICDEIQAEHDHAIATALGKPMEKDLHRALDFMRIWISEDAHLGESEFSYELEKAEGLRRLEAIEQAIAATLESGTCDAVRDKRTQTIVCSKCGGGGLTIPNKGQKALRNFCPNCGLRIRKAVNNDN